MSEKEYLKMLKQTVIEYRFLLGIPSNVTFGVEIEYENVLNEELTYYIESIKAVYKKLYGWKNTIEPDICIYNMMGHLLNGEVKSPILRDNSKSWINLKIILDEIKKLGGLVTEYCGGHINIGTQVLGNNKSAWQNFLLLWILYEREIYKFSSGEFNRIRNYHSISRVSKELKKQLDVIFNEFDLYNPCLTNDLFDKRHDVSLNKVCGFKFQKDNVIEFRIPNGTLNANIWQNNINFFARLLLACNRDLDKDKLLYNINNEQHNVYELAEIVFDNDLNKDYFLIQAMKLDKSYRKILKTRLHN